jgi:hypothetical protein
LYAWAVTVAPTAWSDAELGVARWVAVVAPILLVAGAVLELRAGPRARIFFFWSFVIACGFVWGLAPGQLAPPHFDWVRGFAGMLGWALFALASAAGPARARQEPVSRRPARLDGVAGLPQRRLQADTAWVATGVVLAASVQSAGWQVSGAESALLVRFVTIAAGLVVLGIVTRVAVGRYERRQSDASGARTKSLGARAKWGVLAIGVLAALAGIVFARLLLKGRH